MVNLALAPDNPMNRAMVSCLVCEVIVFGLAFPGMVMVSHVGLLKALLGTIVPCVLCLLAAARLRTPVGYALGWAAQVAGVLMGLLTPMMFTVGVMFLVIWTVSFVLGRRLEDNRPA